MRTLLARPDFDTAHAYTVGVPHFDIAHGLGRGLLTL
jgi:hypothetical protein